MILRDVETRDLGKIAEFAREAFDDFSASDFQKMASDSNYKCFVATKEDEIAGFVVFLRIDSKLEIIKIATNPAYKRQGVASIMMKEVFEFAKNNGHEGVVLEVNEYNLPAYNLYKKMGFKEIFVRKKYYHGTDDAIIMEWLK